MKLSGFHREERAGVNLEEQGTALEKGDREVGIENAQLCP